MIKKFEKIDSNLITFFVLALGVSLRFLVGIRGYNYDFESFKVVAEIMEQGGNVYADTWRYNYGPVWFTLLNLFNQIASLIPDSLDIPFRYMNANLGDNNQEIIFRYLIIGFLTLTDIGIYLILRKKFGKVAAFFFFANPISVVITGYHNQFDNFALFLGMLSVIVFGDDFNEGINKRKLSGLLILGISLMTKHILFAFPVWLAVKQKGFLSKLWVFLIPIFIFFASFIPFLNTGKNGIINYVFLYRSEGGQLFYYYFVPEIIKLFVNDTGVWLFLFVIFGLIFKQWNSFDSLLIYTCVLVAAAPGMARQYLAIVMPLVAAMPNLFFYLFTLTGTWYVLTDHAELHIKRLAAIPVPWINYHGVLISLLFFGLMWLTWHQVKANFGMVKRAFIEIKIQYGFKE